MSDDRSCVADELPSSTAPSVVACDAPTARDGVKHAMIPLLVAQLPDADALLPYLRRIDANRWYTNFGPLVRSLEQRLGDMLFGDERGVVVTTSSGTSALELTLSALQLPPGATVLVPALTFVATATAVLRAGLTPVIADVDRDSWLLTPDIARDCIRRQRIDAVMPVATFGMPQSADAWDAFVDETGIPVLIDAAGAFGNQGPGRRCHVAFSLHATKALSAGEGGLLVTRDGALADRVRMLSNFGIDLQRESQVFAAGSNGKLSEYHAAVAHAALDQWSRTSDWRRAVRQRYLRQLGASCPGVTLQSGAEGGVFPILVVALPGGADARAARAWMAGQGIETRQWYCPTLDRHPAFSAAALEAPANARALSERLIGLPFFHEISDMQMDRVCRELAAFLKESMT